MFLRKFMNVPILKNFPPICHYFLGFRVGKCSASQDSTPRRLGRLFDAAFSRPCHISALHTNFQGNRLYKNSHLQHFCRFRKLSRIKPLNLIKLLNTEMNQNLDYWIELYAKMGTMVPHLQRPELRDSCRSPATINLPRSLILHSGIIFRNDTFVYKYILIS